VRLGARRARRALEGPSRRGSITRATSRPPRARASF